MKKIIAALLSAIIASASVSVFAAEGNVITDDCSDLSAVYERSEYWEVAKDDAVAETIGDSARYKKTNAANNVDDAQYLIYYKGSIKAAEVTFYHTTAKAKEFLKIKYSSDNKSWTEANITLGDSVKHGSWLSTAASAKDFPTGTKYVRIEIEKSNFTRGTACGIGEVKLIEGASLKNNTPISEPGENSAVTDPCRNFDLLFDKSANWAAVDSVADNYAGDVGQFARTSSFKQVGEYLTYKIPGMISADFDLFYIDGVTDVENKLTAEVSNNNSDWTKVPITAAYDSPFSHLSNWYGQKYIIGIPAGGAEYVRITVGDFGATEWVIQFTEFRFESRPYYDKAVGDVSVADGKIKAAYDIPINFSVYDSLTMFIVQYDENEVITDICQYKFTPDSQNAHMEAETELNAQTKNACVYFWNSLDGMHKIANMQSIKIS